MRTSNLVLIAAVFVFGLATSTLEAQLAAEAASAPIVSRMARLLAAPRTSDIPAVSSSALTQSVSPPAVATPYRQWYPYVIARPEDRQWIRETPIELRPNRPLHFWGNSRRRLRRHAL